MSDLRSRGVRVAGADGDAPLTARQSDLRGPLAIVVGSEGQGLGPAVRRRADLFMRIPMKGVGGLAECGGGGVRAAVRGAGPAGPHGDAGRARAAGARAAGAAACADTPAPADAAPDEPADPPKPARARRSRAATTPSIEATDPSPDVPDASQVPTTEPTDDELLPTDGPPARPARTSSEAPPGRRLTRAAGRHA